MLRRANRRGSAARHRTLFSAEVVAVGLDCALQIAGSATFFCNHKVKKAGSSPRQKTPRQPSQGSKAASDGDGQGVADSVTALHNAHGAGAKIGRPGFRQESGSASPFTTHAQADGDATGCEGDDVRRESAKKCEDGKGKDRVDQHALAAVAIGEEPKQKTAEAGGDKEERGERASNRFGHGESREELRQERGIEHHVEAAEKPTETGGEE